MELTIKEFRCLSALKTLGYKYIAKNLSDGVVTVFEQKPISVADIFGDNFWTSKVFDNNTMLYDNEMQLNGGILEELNPEKIYNIDKLLGDIK